MALALLILFGTVIIGHYSVVFLGEGGSHPGLTRATSYRALGGLFFLVALFCLYVLRIVLFNRRMKSLLVEMINAAASSMELDDFLPSIAQKIANTASVTTCQIALLASGHTALKISSAHAEAGVTWQPKIGKTYGLKELTVWGQVADTLQPVVLQQRDLAQLPPIDRELFTGGLTDVDSILAMPMVTKNGIVGIIVLANARGSWKRRFTASRVAMVATLAKHAAGAIDQSQLKKEAIRDPLTNLYNRRHFAERMKEEIARADREMHLMVVLLCDLDRFKLVNDVHGHQVGDAVLKATAESIQDSTRGTDLVFRWGGDEIAVVLPKSSRQGALIVAKRIRQAVLNTAKQVQLDFDVSIGLAFFPEHGRNEDELIHAADSALYIAKRHGGTLQVGEEEYRVDGSSFNVVFQPVVDVAADRVLGYEALARDPQGKLSPLELFEKYGAVGRKNDLKKFVFSAEIRTAHEFGLERLFVNADFDVLSQLQPLPVPPAMDVVVEISEQEALHDVERLLEIAQRWREKGYKFAIDDFGAGFISLPFLAMLVPDYVKVDRSALLQAASSEQFKEFLKSLVQAVRTYATAGIIAEGVEKPEELQIVEDIGISLAQGFLLGKPQELKEATSSVFSSEPWPA
jgi:diguanylate cyclase (GGDEF)-like protein